MAFRQPGAAALALCTQPGPRPTRQSRNPTFLTVSEGKVPAPSRLLAKRCSPGLAKLSRTVVPSSQRVPLHIAPAGGATSHDRVCLQWQFISLGLKLLCHQRQWHSLPVWRLISPLADTGSAVQTCTSDGQFSASSLRHVPRGGLSWNTWVTTCSPLLKWVDM